MQQLAAEPRPARRSFVRSVLFSDVVASTALIDRCGDDAWLTIVDRHARAVCAVARHHRGDVVSFLGDGFMLMFAEPADAVQCALRLQTASRIQDLVHIRIGLDHGEVFHFRDDWYVGRTIHLAARLADVCGNGEIVVSHRCLERARRRIATPRTEPRRLHIRGMREPCTVHVVRPERAP